MFQLLRFKKSDSHISAMVEFEDPSNRLIRHESRFDEYKSAVLWVNVHQTNYIRERILKYVNGCKLLNGSSSDVSMSICYTESRRMQCYPLDQICMAILMMEAHMTAILPSEDHQQYALAKQSLCNILEFAREVLATRARSESEVFGEN